MHEMERLWFLVPIWRFFELFIVTRFCLEIIDDADVKYIFEKMGYNWNKLTNTT